MDQVNTNADTNDTVDDDTVQADDDDDDAAANDEGGCCSNSNKDGHHDAKLLFTMFCLDVQHRYTTTFSIKSC